MVTQRSAPLAGDSGVKGALWKQTTIRRLITFSLLISTSAEEEFLQKGNYSYFERQLELTQTLKAEAGLLSYNFTPSVTFFNPGLIEVVLVVHELLKSLKKAQITNCYSSEKKPVAFP